MGQKDSSEACLCPSVVFAWGGKFFCKGAEVLGGMSNTVFVTLLSSIVRV
jgi:hypothetical protein